MKTVNPNIFEKMFCHFTYLLIFDVFNVYFCNRCYVYFRSSSSADVVPPTGAAKANVYDRVCK